MLSGINQVNLLGRVGRDAEMRGTEAHPVCVFSMATNNVFTKADGEFVLYDHMSCSLWTFAQKNREQEREKGREVKPQVKKKSMQTMCQSKLFINVLWVEPPAKCAHVHPKILNNPQPSSGSNPHSEVLTTLPQGQVGQNFFVHPHISDSGNNYVLGCSCIQCVGSRGVWSTSLDC